MYDFDLWVTLDYLRKRMLKVMKLNILWVDG